MTNKEAIEIIRKEYLCVDRDCDIDKSCGKCDLMMPSKEPILEAYKVAIKALEEPSYNSVKSELDAISRQAVLDAVEDDNRNGMWSCFASDDDAQKFKTVIKDLPSVNPQPKTGHWISHYDEDAKEGWYECDRCHTERAFNTNYCPDCGAKMIEPQESEENE